MYDKHGREIREFDVLKMYHFTGARRKRYYMYKWVIVRDGHWYGHHLGARGDKDAFYLSQDLLEDTEIVQGIHKEHGFVVDYTDRPKRKAPP